MNFLCKRFCTNLNSDAGYLFKVLCQSLILLTFNLKQTADSQQDEFDFDFDFDFDFAVVITVAIAFVYAFSLVAAVRNTPYVMLLIRLSAAVRL